MTRRSPEPEVDQSDGTAPTASSLADGTLVSPPIAHELAERIPEPLPQLAPERAHDPRSADEPEDLPQAPPPSGLFARKPPGPSGS